MTAETKVYIEKNISSIENNGLASAYLNCPLQILNDFNNSMHIAGIEYPPEIHVYVVVCCFMSAYFKNVRLQSYDFDYKTEEEEYKFTCENCLYDQQRLQQSISRLLPKRTVIVETRAVLTYTGDTVLKICVKVS